MTIGATKPLWSDMNEMLDPGAQAHCRRVAAWCEELARVLGIGSDEAAALQEAALMHHHPSALLNHSGASRLAGELGLAFEEDTASQQGMSVRAEQIIAAFRSKRATVTSKRVNELVRILDMTNAFDEQLEFAPFEAEQLASVLQGCLDQPAEGNRGVRFILRYLRKARKGDLAAVMPKLPVYPAVAMKLYTLLASDEVSLVDLDKIAKADQVVAGKMLQAANSVFYSPRQNIKTVSQAISYVGIDDARRILLASAVQPLYSSPRLRHIWKHAVEAAQVAEQIARMSGKVDPAEAFLLGLLHDVGKLAITLMNGELNASLDRLIEKGCEPAVAEVVVCGFDHAEAGAEILKDWKFTEELSFAVRDHHAPERSGSPMAAILYLTEYWTDSEEDLPSNSRLTLAFQVAGITPADLRSAQFELNEALVSL